MLYLNYKYRLYPTKKQEALLNQQFFVANQAWNYALNLRIKDLKNQKGFTPRSMIEKYIKTKLKIRGIKAHLGILQNSVMNLESTMFTLLRMVTKYL